MEDKKKTINHWVEIISNLMVQEFKGRFEPDDLGNYAGYLEGDKYMTVSVRETKWQNRLEGLGLKPSNIIYCTDGQMQFREYEKVPIKLLKLPSPPKRIKKVRKTRLEWKEWEVDGVDIYYIDYNIPRDEREHSVNWNRTEVRVQTFSTSWKNRLESLNFKPDKIVVFENTDERNYTIPKGYLKLPSDRSRRSTEGVVIV